MEGREIEEGQFIGSNVDEEVFEFTFGPPGFLNSWGGWGGGGWGLDDEPVELLLLARLEDVPGLAGAGEAGTPSIPINRLGSSSRCFTKW